MKFLVTGGAGLIGIAVVRFLINETEHEVLNLDKLTYTGNLKNIAEVANSSRYQFTQDDICDRNLLKRTFAELNRIKLCI